MYQGISAEGIKNYLLLLPHISYHGEFNKGKYNEEIWLKLNIPEDADRALIYILPGSWRTPKIQIGLVRQPDTGFVREADVGRKVNVLSCTSVYSSRNGVSLEPLTDALFQAVSERHGVRIGERKVGYNRENVTFCYEGEIGERKDIDIVYEAAVEFLKKRHSKEFEMLKAKCDDVIRIAQKEAALL